MTHKHSEKETRYLREIVGAGGTKVHYFGGTPEQRREIARERKAQRRVTNQSRQDYKYKAERRHREAERKQKAAAKRARRQGISK